MLELKNLYAGYNGVDVIHDITFSVQDGESLCILGPNGCGKSTLLKSITRIIDFRGNVSVNGSCISAISRKELAKKVALLSQSTQFFFPYTVYETVAMGRYAHSSGFLKNLSVQDEDIIKDVLKKLDISDIKDRLIDELSGGTLQRVFLARTLTQMPDLILLDEPANHLDLKHQIELLDFLKTWVRENNKTLISVFHDLNIARLFGDTAVILNNGTIAASGKIDEVLNNSVLSDVYRINIRAFMYESLKKWT
ncbi:MAG: ABC transporter ATP-binding protein [Treponema sp.]|jgi:iron complex transport system ATP-binding protein|nr:ABC transporter ATP-binding protein [Treponema sp.]